jgi:hypothetical protein
MGEELNRGSRGESPVSRPLIVSLRPARSSAMTASKNMSFPTPLPKTGLHPQSQQLLLAFQDSANSLRLRVRARMRVYRHQVSHVIVYSRSQGICGGDRPQRQVEWRGTRGLRQPHASPHPIHGRKSTHRRVSLRSLPVRLIFLFSKIKFDEPYMMYRDWREIIKSLLSRGENAKLPKDKMKRSETKTYVEWVRREIENHPKLF